MHGMAGLLQSLPQGLPQGFLPAVLTSGVIPGLAAVAVRGAWESLVIAVFLSVLPRWMPGLSPKAGFRAWGAGFALSAVLPLCHPGDGVITGWASGYAFSVLPSAGPVAHRALPLMWLSPIWAAGLCALWAGASTVMLVRFGAGVWSLWRLLEAATPAPPALQATYRELMADGESSIGRGSSRTRGARLLIADGIAAPSACGLFGACIVLPSGLLESLSLEEREGVLRHEAAHLRRWDDWFTALARFALAMLPFALGMPYLERRMARAREMACDDAALGPHVSRRGYAACLARLAEGAAAQEWHKLAPGLAGNGSQLAARVGRLLRGSAVPGPGRVKLAAAGCAGALLSIALLGAPAFLVFTTDAETARVVEPGLASRPVETILPMEKIRPVRWSVPGVRGRRWTPALQVAGSRAKRLRSSQAEIEEPTVLVLWTDRQGFSNGSLILLVAHSGCSATPGWSNVFPLTI